MQGSSEQFLRLAEQRLAAVRTQVVADADDRRKAIETLVAPLRETLGKLETRTAEIEKARESAYSRIDEQVKALAHAASKLELGTNTLATALRSSQVRGKWGEIAHLNSPAPDPRAVEPRVAPPLAELCLSLMRKSPAARPESAAATAAALTLLV